MRITINYFEGYPELEAELAKFTPRARAERLRLLAAMGLSFMQDGRFNTFATAPAISQNAATSTPPASPVVLAAPARTTSVPVKTGEQTNKDVARSITQNIFNQANE